jgi:hypothetical protein
MSKFSSYKSHQLITESWRRFLNEGKEEQLARAGQEALEELGEDEIMARLEALPPEIQAQLDAAATDIAEKFASQLQEGDVSSGREWEGDDRDELRVQDEWENFFATGGGGLGALGGLAGAIHWKIAAESALAFLGAPIIGFGLGAGAGMLVAGAFLSARKKLRKDLRDTTVTEPVSGPEPA